MRLILDTPFKYYGYSGAHESMCRVRLFVPEPGQEQLASPSFDPLDPRTWHDERGYTDPVILITDPPENKGTSVTNMIEYIAADILVLWMRDKFGGFNCPTSYYTVTQNPPDEGVRNHSEYSRVTFAGGVPQRTAKNCGMTLPARWVLGAPTWSPLTEDQAVAMMGEALEHYPALSHRRPIAEPLWAQLRYGNPSGIER